ncbi:MAG: hypothetical protein EP335_02070 [Alphaproteobacteria bacterium]|nr:MAG: hypothetical protein EP335_02070 [Alphaproteobacteria bacterium]
MSPLRKLVFVLFASICTAAGASAQILDIQNDPRQLGLDIFGGINREVPPATTALKLSQLIQIYRFRCTRVTDFQLYNVRPNLIDMKVKCSGDPLYGVTVASNGYVAVYGGNGMLAGLDRRDSVIYSVAADGTVEGVSRISADEALEETLTRLQQGDDFNLAYMGGMLGMIAFVILAGSLIWFKAWKNRKGKPRKRRTVEPLRRTASVASTAAKDILILQSERIMPHIYKHPSGIFIAQGRRGKRRFFSSLLWAVAYRSLGWKLFQTIPPKAEDFGPVDEAVGSEESA